MFSTDNTTQEAKKFLCLLCGMHDSFEEDFRYMKILERTVSYSEQFVPDFNAAGFFSINRRIFLSITCNVATYFIISLQLRYA